MTEDELRDLRLLVRIWDEMAEVPLNATDDEIADTIRSEGRDPEQVARHTKHLVEEALQRPQHDQLPSATPIAAKIRLLRGWWPSLRLDFCLADLRPQELRNPATLQALLAAFVALPILVGGAVALILSAAGISTSTVLFGGIAGALVAFTGTLVCSAPVSVVAASLGGIPVSLVLGIVSGLLLESKGGVKQAGELLCGTVPVIPGLGGLSALVRPSGISVALVAMSVVLLSLAMGGTRSIAGQRSGTWTAASVVKAVSIGIVGALGPGLVYGISRLVGEGPLAVFAFALGLAVFGGLAFGAAAGIRSGSSRRGLSFGLCYGMLTLLFITLGFQLESAFWRLLLATTTNHILLQGTFFACTYVAAEKIGGPRSGIIASTVEGIPPYCIFILTRPWT